MNKYLLRLYKYYLTYLSAPVNRLRRCRPEKKSLFIAKFDGLGDFFLLLPLLKKLCGEGYPITVAGSGFQKEILDHCGLAIPAIPFGTGSFPALRTAIDAARTLRPEFAANLSMSAWGGILVNQTRAPLLAGLLQEREWYVYKGHALLYDRTFSCDPALHSFEVNCRFFSDLLHLDNLACVEPFLERPVVAGAEVAIHPYGKWPPRRWPRFVELIGRLTAAGYRCVVLGTAAEHASGDYAVRFGNNPLCRIARCATVADLLAELERCRAFIGNDSGPAHYASLIGKPTFVLWGPGNFERIRQIGRNVHIFKKEIACRPCRQRDAACPEGQNKCLQMIGVDEVVAAFCETIDPMDSK